jgi:hypothetical protein
MRAGIGVLSLLIVIAIILFAAFSGPHGGYVPTVVQTGQNAQSQAQQIAGRDENGVPIQQTITLEEDSPNGQMRGLVVKKLLPTGPLATDFGLLPGDEIVEAGDMDLRGQSDPELAKDMVYQSYSTNKPLVVLRNGQKVTLTPDSALTAAHPNLFGTPGAAVNQPPANSNNIPTH